ncbi:phage integrase family protein [Rivularia sp. PCC 7116]|uniref:phage integrase n=1 Tax=Rivularia sp. PCC 7116 TaxID=373994 RepID=UPI00029ECF69|nr:phage integrase [Rivularia sp. PCC 7116]AFY58704.1 phage integrase family protein [Rivularia sp. PCC 7116]
MVDIQGKAFSDFDVPTTSDGSYMGRKKIVDATKEHHDMKFEQELVKINQRLKSSKTKVSIEASKGGIQLRATLPLKPGDSHKQGKNRKQYKISLGIPANFDGLKTGEEEAYELGKLIARKTFVWNDKYLGQQAKKKNSITFKEFYEQFEKIYFQTRKKTIRSEHSFLDYQRKFKRYFYSDDAITIESLKEKITQANTFNTRRIAIIIAHFICKALDIKHDFSDLKIKKQFQTRDIPDDKRIVNSLYLIDSYLDKIKPCNRDKSAKVCKRNQVIVGLLAVYGLRPREIFNQPYLDWLMSFENKHNTFKVHKSNKTGYREVFPFVPEWIELFDLKNQENINLLQQYISEEQTAIDLHYKVSKLGDFFKSYKFSFTPYDLRHACAIRAHLQGIPIKAAADNLGHTVEIHTKVYQQWFGFENRRKAFDRAFDEMNQIEECQRELVEAKKRVAELEAEVTRLRLESSLR